MTNPGLIAAISTICVGTGMLPSGATAVKHRVFADIFRNIPANSGSYIYNTTSKHICWDGYYLDKTKDAVWIKIVRRILMLGPKLILILLLHNLMLQLQSIIK